LAGVDRPLELLLLACGTISTQARLALGCASRRVARLGRPSLAKQPVPSHPAQGVRPRTRCHSWHRV